MKQPNMQRDTADARRPELHKAAKAELYGAFAGTGKALGNGSRLELLDLIAQGERTVERLSRAAGLGLTTTSAHLQVLKQAGLVHSRRDGVRIYYSLAGEDVAQLLVLLRRVAEAHRLEVGVARQGYLGTDGITDAEITHAELVERIEAGGAVVLDVRPVEEYAAGHIPGAVSIPVEELSERVDELTTDVEVVVYCRGEYCVLAYDAVRLLRQRGRRVIRLQDGMLEWRLADLPVAVGATS